MKIALGQFAVRPDWQDNAAICLDLIARADAGGARLLVLPEGILARDIADPDLVRRAAQPLDGPYMTRMLEATRDRALTLVMTVHVPADQGKVWNIQVALRGGRIVAQYRKLHLYDAFSMQESVNVVPGDEVPPLLEVDGLRFGMMTCYDLRFPELARRLAVDGADALLVPAAWVKGPLKEHHWEVLATARALDNTCYVVAVGECGPRNIGASMVVDPLGVAIARAAEQDALLYAELDPRRLAQARQALPVLANRRFARPELA
ncbi:deaminated glutathione amidase [Achromobacter xylosoxidans]